MFTFAFLSLLPKMAVSAALVFILVAAIPIEQRYHRQLLTFS